MSARPYVLAETAWPALSDAGVTVAVLPWGATEPHNFHLPHGTDTYQSDALAAEGARRAWARGAKAMVLPTVPFGCQTGQRDLSFAPGLLPSTQQAILRDLAHDLERRGVAHLVLFNGHGGNEFRAMLRELQPGLRLHLLLVNWYALPGLNDLFDEAGDHAGELETSVMLHLRPDLVRPLDEAGPGTEHLPHIPAMRSRWAWAPRPWTEITDDTGVGNPKAAAAAKGAAALDAVAEALADLLVALDATPRDRLYRPSD